MSGLNTAPMEFSRRVQVPPRAPNKKSRSLNGCGIFLVFPMVVGFSPLTGASHIWHKKDNFKNENANENTNGNRYRNAR